MLQREEAAHAKALQHQHSWDVLKEAVRSVKSACLGHSHPPTHRVKEGKGQVFVGLVGLVMTWALTCREMENSWKVLNRNAM